MRSCRRTWLILQVSATVSAVPSGALYAVCGSAGRMLTTDPASVVSG
jgi:hypothetical protein